MLVIALTGGIACGKSTVSAMLKTLGASIIDADQISRSLTAPGGEALPAVRQAFGDAVFHEDGTLNRQALSALVFADRQAVEMLNAIIHPMVQRRMLDAVQEAGRAGEKLSSGASRSCLKPAWTLSATRPGC